MQSTSKSGAIHLISAHRVLTADLKGSELLVAVQLLLMGTDAESRIATVKIERLTTWTGLCYDTVHRSLESLRQKGWFELVERHGAMGSAYTWSAQKLSEALVPERRIHASSTSTSRKAQAPFRRHDSADFARMGTSTSLLRDGSLGEAERHLVDVMARELAVAKASRERVPRIAREYVRAEVGAQIATWMREQIAAYQLTAEVVARAAARAYLQEDGRAADARHPLGWMIHSGAALSAAIARAAQPKPLETLQVQRAVSSERGFGGFGGANDVLAAIGGAR